MKPRVLIIAGPTASGKSALALDIARRLGGRIINADSMQVYADLRILTARPGPEALAEVPHRLYGVLDGDELCTAARWAEMAAAEIAEAQAEGVMPILVGGTGLYLRVLIDGIAPVPEIPEPIRSASRTLHAMLGGPAFHAELGRRDPVMAARLRPSDAQRLMRAHEVIMATGRSLADWQEEGRRQRRFEPLAFTLLPPREALYAACDARFAAMVAGGALDEIARLAERKLSLDRPILKALGVPELLRYHAGSIGLDAAIAQGQQATRNYAKRQTTWFRHQMAYARPIFEQYNYNIALAICQKVLEPA
jgi:tRNA dimethylallyltransferase